MHVMLGHLSRGGASSAVVTSPRGCLFSSRLSGFVLALGELTSSRALRQHLRWAAADATCLHGMARARRRCFSAWLPEWVEHCLRCVLLSCFDELSADDEVCSPAFTVCSCTVPISTILPPSCCCGALASSLPTLKSVGGQTRPSVSVCCCSSASSSVVAWHVCCLRLRAGPARLHCDPKLRSGYRLVEQTFRVFTQACAALCAAANVLSAGHGSGGASRTKLASKRDAPRVARVCQRCVSMARCMAAPDEQ
jgi:hypothetical protein